MSPPRQASCTATVSLRSKDPKPLDATVQSVFRRHCCHALRRIPCGSTRHHTNAHA
jgi:O6-methylguanine-DNA--protein-cysteine methyltransferase